MLRRRPGGVAPSWRTQPRRTNFTIYALATTILPATMPSTITYGKPSTRRTIELRILYYGVYTGH